MTDRIRVVLVDDDPLVRGGLTMMLGGNDRIEVIGEAENGREGVAGVAGRGPVVGLLDLRMRVLGGLGAGREGAGPGPPPPHQTP
ncbi:MAG: response regulator transcription factor, partial [Microbacterium gubbeenense]|uniref:response regulator transcription factor n=1 Tax=Microbacterium gubbeenense TaxID=159896 RepID=UPI003F952589